MTNNFLMIKDKQQWNGLNQKVPVTLYELRLEDQLFVSPGPSTVPGKYNKCARNNY